MATRLTPPSRGAGSALLTGSQGCVKDHRHEVGGHAVSDRIQGFVEVAADLFLCWFGAGRARVANDLSDLGRRQLLVASAVGCGVHESDRRTDQLALAGDLETSE